MKICKEFYFDAAHYLPKYKGKCESMHGHTYKFEVVLKGKPGKDGMVMDFLEIKRAVESRVLSKLDHKNLNDLLEVPTTAENIVMWIFTQLRKELPVESVKLWEGKNSWVEYDGA